MNFEKIINTLQKIIGWFIFTLTAVIVAIFFYIESIKTEEGITKISILEFIQDLSTNTIPSLLVIGFSYTFLQKLKSYLSDTKDKNFKYEIANEVYETIRPYFNNDWKTADTFYKVNWKYLFSNHKDITIATHYLDSWISGNKDIIKEFFKSKKKLTLIIPDATNEEHIKIIASRFNRQPHEVIAKITNCKSKINAIKSKIQNGSPGLV